MPCCNPYAKCRQLFGEGRRRTAVGEAVLKAVPGAGDAAIDDASLAKRSVLMRAEIGQCADLVAVAEHRDPLAAGSANDARGAVRDVVRRTDRDPAVGGQRRAAVGAALAKACGEVQHGHDAEARNQHGRNEQGAFIDHDAERHMHHHQPIGDIERHVQRLPHRRGEEGEPEIVAGRSHQEQHQQRREPERLEWKADELAVAPDRGHFGDQIGQRVLYDEPVDHQGCVHGGDEERQHAEMTPVGEQRQETAIEPRQRTDRQNDRQHEKGTTAVGANPDVDFVRPVRRRVKMPGDQDEARHIERDAND